MSVPADNAVSIRRSNNGQSDDKYQMLCFVSGCVLGSTVLIFSVVSDAVSTWDGALFTRDQKIQYQTNCVSGTLPSSMLAGLALLSIAMAVTVIGTVTLLAFSCCGCALCCLPRACCDPVGQASASLGVSIVLMFLSLPLFSWNIAVVASALSACRSSHADDCFEYDYAQPYCALTLARAGIGSMAGLAGCVALILAGNFAYLGPAVMARAAALAAALDAATASAPAVAIRVVRAETADVDPPQPNRMVLP
jgi:hypothetical protein